VGLNNEEGVLGRFGSSGVHGGALVGGNGRWRGSRGSREEAWSGRIRERGAAASFKQFLQDLKNKQVSLH
jgi:hypothetical protein